MVNVIYTLTLYAALYRGWWESRQVADFFWVCALGYLGRAQVMQTVRMCGRLNGAMEGGDDVSAEVNMGSSPAMSNLCLGSCIGVALFCLCVGCNITLV